MPILILSILGSIISIIIGTFWYSPLTPMGRLHMRFLGFDKLSPAELKKKMEEAKTGMPKVYAAQLVLSFLTAFFTVFVVTMSVQNGVSLLMAVGFPVFAWLCFSVPVVGMQILWGGCDRNIAWQKFFSDTLSILVSILITALLASFFV